MTTVTRMTPEILDKLIEDASPTPWMYDDGTNSGFPGVWCGHPDGIGGPIFEVADDYPRGVNAPLESMELTCWLVNHASEIATLWRMAREIEADPATDWTPPVVRLREALIALEVVR